MGVVYTERIVHCVPTEYFSVKDLKANNVQCSIPAVNLSSPVMLTDVQLGSEM